jgi:hypothetical protein
MNIEFKRVRNPIGRGFDHEAHGEFKRGATMLRIAKDGRKVKLIAFYHDNPLGEVFCKCASIKDAKETAEWQFKK